MIYDSMDNDVTMRGFNGSALGRIDQYELLKELGGGGFGTVYLARDTVSGVDVAVKGLPPLVKNNREEMENIRSNFALVSRLHHPHIAAALVLHPAKEVAYATEDVRQKLRVDPGDTLMVMEYAPGVTLSKWRKQFPNGIVPFAKALEITRQIASALDYAHERKIVHRDVKPANVMVETAANGSVTARVLDFGLAAEVRSSMGRVSREIHDTSGTRPYMAPEQWGGDRQGPATDQYALAATFYELVAGHVPFANAFETGDPMIMITVVTTRQPEMPDSFPESARIALARALAKRSEERFASCGDFTAALAGTAPSAAHSHVKAAGTEEDAKRARVEAKIREKHLRNISDDDGFGERKAALNEVFQRAELYFESELWADAARQFNEYVAQVEELEKLDSERKTANEAERNANEERVPNAKVQLWEGGPYWATKNIGAENPEDYGYYFWWGDTVGYKRVGDSWEASDGSKSGFSFEGYKTPTYGKSIDVLKNMGWITVKGKGWFSKKYALAPECDVAHVHWGGEWRMPTEQELDDLTSKCDWEWTTLNGVNGYKVCGRGNYASASIFLPCAGTGYGTSLYDAGSYGRYWSSVPNSDFDNAWYLYFNSGYHSTSYGNGRFDGQSVRPVQGFTK